MQERSRLLGDPPAYPKSTKGNKNEESGKGKAKQKQKRSAGARRVLDAASTADAKGITAIVEEQPLNTHVKGMPFQAQRLPFCRCAYFMGRAT